MSETKKIKKVILDKPKIKNKIKKEDIKKNKKEIDIKLEKELKGIDIMKNRKELNKKSKIWKILTYLLVALGLWIFILTMLSNFYLIKNIKILANEYNKVQVVNVELSNQNEELIIINKKIIKDNANLKIREQKLINQSEVLKVKSEKFDKINELLGNLN